MKALEMTGKRVVVVLQRNANGIPGIVLLANVRSEVKEYANQRNVTK